jgi:hypothetical protein
MSGMSLALTAKAGVAAPLRESEQIIDKTGFETFFRTDNSIQNSRHT